MGSSDPQKENGYTQIANEIMEALAKTAIGNSNAQVLWAIIRKTYGWNKKKDKISISQLQKMTNCSRRTIIYALQNLETKKMIIIKKSRKSSNENDINEISFNKKYAQWVVQEKSNQYDNVLKTRRNYYAKNKSGVVQEIGGGARNGKEVVQETVKDVPFLAPTKETITKETIQKKLYTSDSEEIRLSKLLLDKIMDRDPDFKIPDLQKWSMHIERMIRMDKRTVEKIEKVTRWCQADSFWQNNILSTLKLRKQFSQLWLKMPKGDSKYSETTAHNIEVGKKWLEKRKQIRKEKGENEN
jgi:phage replication O-like protein O